MANLNIRQLNFQFISGMNYDLRLSIAQTQEFRFPFAAQFTVGDEVYIDRVRCFFASLSLFDRARI